MKVRIRGHNPLSNKTEIGFIESLVEGDRDIDLHKWSRSPEARRNQTEGIVKVKFRTRRVDGKLMDCMYALLLSEIKPCIFNYNAT